MEADEEKEEASIDGAIESLKHLFENDLNNLF